MMKNYKGFTAIAVIFVLVILIAVVTLGTYMILSNQGTETVITRTTPTPQSTSDQQMEEEVSDSLELDVIEEELEDTEVGSPEADLEEFSDEATGL